MTEVQFALAFIAVTYLGLAMPWVKDFYVEMSKAIWTVINDHMMIERSRYGR